MDGIIAIVLPAWTLWIIIGLLVCITFLEAWRIKLLLDDRRERRSRRTAAGAYMR